jgi:hypothetical protein
MKRFLILLCLAPALTFARKMPPKMIDDQAYISQPKFKHYIGVQSNLLIRQVFNLSGNTATTNNPYLFTYAINNRRGWGLATGFGMTTTNNSISDATGSYDKDYNKAASLRLGIEKRFFLHPKWSAVVGLDALMNLNESKSDVKDVQSFGGFTSVNSVTSTTSFTDMGASLRAALNFSITSKLMIGTETSISYTSGTEKFSGSTFSDNGMGNINATITSNTTERNGLGMNVPTAFFVILKF